MFPDEFEQFSNYVFKESIATSGGPEYTYDYGDTDDYDETIYPQCPHNCVRHSFCNLTGGYLLDTVLRFFDQVGHQTIFSLNHVIVRPIKIMNRADKN